MSNQKDSTSSFLDMLSDIKDSVFLQKGQAISLTEQMIQSMDSCYIAQIMYCFPIGDYVLSQLDADMRRLSIICEIVAAEEKLPGSKILFLENVSTFDDLMEKYIRITLLLRRLELQLPREALEEAIVALIEEQISACALRKITESEIFAKGDYVYSQGLQVTGGI